MKRIFFCITLVLYAIGLIAQKREEGFDYSFKPTTFSPYYYVVTEKRDTGWHREAWYLSQKSLAIEGWYKDEACKIPHGVVTSYHPTRFPKNTGLYVNGKKEGAWLEYDDEGRVKDSANYVAGRLTGVRLGWHSNGMLADSSEFDGAGNGVQVQWNNQGLLSSAGYMVSDTLKKGRWKYYQNDGKLLAIEDYKDGKLTSCNCFTEAGISLDTSLCPEKEATVLGGANVWRTFLEKNINLDIPLSKKVPNGQYNVIVRFLVDKEGQVTDAVTLTNFGYGMEEMVLEIFKKAPRWTPGRQHGRTVKSYHTQPITLSFSEIK